MLLIVAVALVVNSFGDLPPPSLYSSYLPPPPRFLPTQPILRVQSCLDASFGMVYEQLRQKAFCRGGRQRETARGNDNSPAGSEATGVVGEGADDGPGGGRAATSPDEQVLHTTYTFL